MCRDASCVRQTRLWRTLLLAAVVACIMWTTSACGPLPTPGPRFTYIEDVSPRESAIIRLSVYRHRDACPPGFEFGSGCARGICVQFTVHPELWEADDDFTDIATVESRVTLSLDGHTLPRVGVGTVPTLVVGQPWMPFYVACSEADPGIGTHKATFQFRKTSGQVSEYTWYFLIIPW